MPKGVPKNGINKGWFKNGRTVSLEERENLSIKLSGKKKKQLTEEHKRKLSEALIGKTISEETRKKISKTLTGFKRPFKKKRPMSEETKLKLSKSKKGIPNKFKGIPRSDETKRKISEIKKKNRHKHWLWKGGITPLSKQIRKSVESKIWRNKIFERDNFTCQKCNKKGGWNKLEKRRIILQAHHIKPFSIIFEQNNIKSFEEAKDCKEFWCLDNGITLCLGCHKTTDTYGININKLNKKL